MKGCRCVGIDSGLSVRLTVRTRGTWVRLLRQDMLKRYKNHIYSFRGTIGLGIV